MDPSQQLPSMPMTGPTPAPRRLSQPQQIPQQDGNGESETDFAAMPGNDYIVPANPQVLKEHAAEPHIVQSVLRRRLQPETFGPRRL